jgi:hypothetical protein
MPLRTTKSNKPKAPKYSFVRICTPPKVWIEYPDADEGFAKDGPMGKVVGGWHPIKRWISRNSRGDETPMVRILVTLPDGRMRICVGSMKANSPGFATVDEVEVT